MKRNKSLILMAILACGLMANAQSPDAPEKKPDAAPEPKPVTDAAQAPSTNAAAPALVTNAPVRRVTSETEKGLRLNFRGVPLDMVLNYLSDAAGFIIVMETEPKGKVDVWSNQPMTKDEAVELLNSILNRNGYAAIRN